MNAKSLLCSSVTLFLFVLVSMGANDSGPAATATNQFGIDLYRKLATGEDTLCFSPYSIEMALVMAFEGAEGQTREEMA